MSEDGSIYFDGGHKLGGCEAFELGSGPFDMQIQNQGSDAACLNQIAIYGNTDKSLGSSLIDIPFRTCQFLPTWFESNQAYLEQDHALTNNRITCAGNIGTTIKKVSLKVEGTKENAGSTDDIKLFISNGTDECESNTLSDLHAGHNLECAVFFYPICQHL